MSMLKLFKMKDEKKPDALPLPKDMTLDEVRLAMLELMGQEDINHHRMSQLYNYVVDRRLAEAAGYKHPPDYFSKHLVDMSRATLVVYGTVASHFSESTSRRFGITCLSLLLTYAEASDFEVNSEEPGTHVIEVPGDNGAVTPKPFGQCSVDEMRKALQRKRKPASSKPLPTEDLALPDRYLEAVTGGLPRGSARVQVRNHKGKAVLDFRGIPLTHVAQLAQVLLAQATPQPAEVTHVQKAPQVN